jgi:plasmid maintenance system antidote protein VapI
MGGPTSGRYITLKPASRAAERIVAYLLKEEGPTCEQLAAKLGVSLSAFTRYLKGDRAIPLWAAVKVEQLLKIPVEEWLDKPRSRAAA